MLWRRLISWVGLALLCLGGYGYVLLGQWELPLPPEAAPGLGAADFHHYDRAQVADTAQDGYCATCHPALAHWRDPGRRAFLNLHQRTLDCGVCHLRGRGVAPRHFRGDELVTAETLADAAYGRIFAARREAAQWRRLQRPDAGVQLRRQGPDCVTCHRRGSPLLAAAGLFDAYRRRVLEDLSVLRHLGGVRR